VEDLSSPIDTNVLREELEIITDITYRILEKYSIQKYESITENSVNIFISLLLLIIFFIPDKA
jgi:hypothetical protein